MRLWKLPSWVDPKRALRTLNRAASEGGVVPAVKERVRELARRGPVSVDLPGFHLFDRAYPVSPYTWLLPKPKGDVQDLLNLWESYVNQDAVQCPMKPIESDRFVLGQAGFRRVFGGPRDPAEWAQPAAMMIALAQHLEGQENLHIELSDASKYERRRIDKLRMHVSEYVLEVTPTGMYSNLAGGVINPVWPATDAKLDGLCIRPLRTSHPLAVALAENEDTPYACLQAANVVVRGLQAGQLADKDLKLAGGPAAPRAVREAAVIEAIGHLDQGKRLRPVYDAIVPHVISAAEFRRDFGNPFRDVGDPRSETVDRWKEHLFALVT